VPVAVATAVAIFSRVLASASPGTALVSGKSIIALRVFYCPWTVFPHAPQISFPAVDNAKDVTRSDLCFPFVGV